MGRFITYLLENHGLTEVSQMFPTAAFNALLRQEIEKVMPFVSDPKLQADLRSLLNINAVGYADRSLARAGFGDEERDGLVHDLFVRWLVKPGGLVGNWKMDAPLSLRFKRALKNAIATLAVRASRRRRRFEEMPDDQLQDERTKEDDDLIGDFRAWLRQTLGASAVAVIDTRLAGGNINSLIGVDPGIRSSYRLKEIVKAIKAAATRWAAADAAFQNRVRQLMDAEHATVAKRFRKRAGRV